MSQADLPAVLTELRRRIDEAQATNAAFQADAAAFLKQAKTAINPSVTADDVREMLIQHILPGRKSLALVPRRPESLAVCYINLFT